MQTTFLICWAACGVFISLHAAELAGAPGPVGTQAGAKLVHRLEITKPGVYENFRVDAQGQGGNIVKITADNVTVRNCEIFNGAGNGAIPGLTVSRYREDLKKADKIEGEITGFNKIRAISVTADGKTLFAANSGSNDIAVVDIAARRVTGTVPVGRDPYGAALTPDGRFVYSGNLADNTVSVIDVATLKVVATIAGFKQPRQAIVFTRDAKTAYVLNEDLSISKVERAGQRIVATVAAAQAVAAY